MRSTPLTLLTLVTALAQAHILKRQSNSSDEYDGNSIVEEYFDAVCLPVTAQDYPDYNAPCWQLQVIQDECTYGSEASWNQTSISDSSSYGSEDAVLSPRDQQLCVCDSDFWQAIDGCVACANKHGLAGAIPDFDPSAISSFSASYCTASNTATIDLAAALDSAFASYISSSYPITTATTYTDPIGSRTEVSLYFTPSATTSSSGSAITIASTTASASASASAAQSTGAATVGASVDKFAVAGMIGLVAVVAAL